MTDLAQRLRAKANDFYDFNGETMKYWDDIRHKVETLPGSDLPRLMFESILEECADLFREAAETIDPTQVPHR